MDFDLDRVGGMGDWGLAKGFVVLACFCGLNWGFCGYSWAGADKNGELYELARFACSEFSQSFGTKIWVFQSIFDFFLPFLQVWWSSITTFYRPVFFL